MVDWTSQEFGGWRPTNDNGGGGGNNAFVVNYILNGNRLDKTYAEIAAAFASGKLCYIYQDADNMYDSYGGSYNYKLITDVTFYDNADPANVFYAVYTSDNTQYYCLSPDEYPQG